MLILLFWANRVPFTSIHALLDVDDEAEYSFRMALAMQQQTDGLKVGGPGCIVEVDEMEFGRKKKGRFGKAADPKVYIWG